MCKGTPKTLFEALENGVDNHFDTDARVLYDNARDFLAQKFTVWKCKAYKQPLTHDDLQVMYEDIIK